ncbi:MAG: Farnesyl diphosphate synthase [Chlamydiae bacterium]|nr:Farnesyl diphosphate synthase [Chlamydiota bacterium]
MPYLDTETVKLKSLLFQYQTSVNEIIAAEIKGIGGDSKLKEACLYALVGDGKRFRPSIVLILSNLLGGKYDVGLSALSVELFHTASLIADDMPCMDDDSIRRNKPALHKVFGTDVALLSSYATLGAGYECILKQRKKLAGKLCDIDERSFIAIGFLARNNSLDGAPLGQFLDLYPPEITEESLKDVLYRKTVIFFETAFIFGWLFGGGDLTLLEKVRQAGCHFGMAFQIYDDFCDYEKDLQASKKINYPLAFGKERARTALEKELKLCQIGLTEVGLYKEEFQELLKFLDRKVLNGG